MDRVYVELFYVKEYSVGMKGKSVKISRMTFFIDLRVTISILTVAKIPNSDAEK